jgi:carboxypeptidase C (cathepsin A)
MVGLMLLAGALVTLPQVLLATPAAPPTPAAAADKVLSLPGWAGALPSEHYSGYINCDADTKQLHYYLQEADADATSKPLVLWLNGGPGATSLIGAFTELGQLIFNRDSTATVETPAAPSLFRNPLSWTTSANVLYLENPAGVGFSRCLDPESKCASNDTSAALDAHEVLVGFFERFPHFKKSNFYLTGESYAGVYIPMLLNEIYKQGVITNVAGTAIGNGCWGTAPGTNCGDVTGHSGTVKKIDVEYWLGRGLISATLAQVANDACDDGAWTDPLSAACLAAYKNISNALGPMDIDNVDSFCPFPGSSHLTTLEEHRDVWRLHSNQSHRDPVTGLWVASAGSSASSDDGGAVSPAAAAAAAPPIGAVSSFYLLQS